MEVPKNTVVEPILKNRKNTTEPVKKEDKIKRLTFFHTENVVRLSSIHFTLQSDIKLGLEYNNLFAILFYYESDDLDDIFGVWDELSSIGGIILASLNMDFESDLMRTIKELSPYHPFFWLNNIHDKSIVIYNEGWPQGIYDGAHDKEKLKEYLNIMKQRNFAFQKDGSSVLQQLSFMEQELEMVRKDNDNKTKEIEKLKQKNTDLIQDKKLLDEKIERLEEDIYTREKLLELKENIYTRENVENEDVENEEVENVDVENEEVENPENVEVENVENPENVEKNIYKSSFDI